MSKRKPRKTSKAESLLVELLAEELPPKALRRIGEAFASGIASGLAARGLVANGAAPTVYATPRRLAAKIAGVFERAPDRAETKKLMPTKVAYDTDGKATPALLKRLEKEGFPPGTFGEPIKELLSEHEGYVLLTQTIPGPTLAEGLQAALNEAIAKLPTPKLMSYQLADGVTAQQFVRPAHRLLVIHGRKVVGVSVLGLKSGNSTCGHRFLSKGNVTVPHAEQYEQVLENKGRVIASFEKRKQRIRADLEKQAGSAKVLFDEALLDEVAALVEFPAVYAGKFNSEFLDVPQECLILSMRQHQRYFPLADANGKLLPRFLMVSNVRATDPENIVHGNERVLRARLADAKFFYSQDQKERLEERVPRLSQVVYHNKLGSQLDRVKRVQLLASGIARDIGADDELTKQAAWLSKADLVTGMVGEFPELQGVMGRYYALHDGESPEVADAIEQHYWPRFAGDMLPKRPIACAVALADKLDALAGLFSIGEQPTGDKDPFGLRRAALGVIRIFVQNQISLSLFDLVDAAFKPFESNLQRDKLWLFFVERMRSYFQERGYTANEVEAVLSVSQGAASPINLIPKQLEAVRAFSELPEAASLAAANKRIANILRQAASKGESFANADVSELKEPAEIALFEALQAASRSAKSLFDSGDFAGYLKTFASLKSPVDSFFDTVTVMADKKELRENRLALLTDMRKAMNRFSDISKLAA